MQSKYDALRKMLEDSKPEHMLDMLEREREFKKNWGLPEQITQSKIILRKLFALAGQPVPQPIEAVQTEHCTMKRSAYNQLLEDARKTLNSRSP